MTSTQLGYLSGATSDIQTQLSGAGGTAIYMALSSTTFTINISGCSKGYISVTEGFIKMQVAYNGYPTSANNVDYSYFAANFILRYNKTSNSIIAIGAGYTNTYMDSMTLQSTGGSTYSVGRFMTGVFNGAIQCTVSGSLSSANFNIYNLYCYTICIGWLMYPNF